MSESPENENSTSPEQQSTLKAKLLSWLPYVLIPLLVYFGNVELQSYLGRKALEEANLPMHELDDAFIKAKQEGKLVLADMSAIWCPSCRKLDNEVLSKEAVKQAIEKDYVFSRIEYESEEGKAFMKKYGVSAFPTILVLDAQGNKLAKLPLTFEPQRFISLIRRS